MTETRKKIIGLIRPYMDKSLVAGCIVGNPARNKNNPYYLSQFISAERKSKEYLINGICLEKNNYITFGVDEIEDLDIFGTYDITAVLQYIQSIVGSDNIFYDSDCFRIHYNIENMFSAFAYPDEKVLEIQNKPLHLNTEKEDKELLEGLLDIFKYQRYQ